LKLVFPVFFILKPLFQVFFILQNLLPMSFVLMSTEQATPRYEHKST
jgi:hypothetical protein